MQDFTNIPVGTKCFVKTRFGWYVTYISRHTKTQVITKRNAEDETRWKINTGHLLGGDKWSTQYLEVFTDKHQVIVDATLLKRKVSNVVDLLQTKVDDISQEDYEVLRTLADKYTSE